MWDQIAVSGTSEGRIVDYMDFLQADVFTTPVAVEQGHYVAPTEPGWGLEMRDEFISAHRFPDGEIWRNRPGPVGALFEA